MTPFMRALSQGVSCRLCLPYNKTMHPSSPPPFSVKASSHLTAGIAPASANTHPPPICPVTLPQHPLPMTHLFTARPHPSRHKVLRHHHLCSNPASLRLTHPLLPSPTHKTPLTSLWTLSLTHRTLMTSSTFVQQSRHFLLSDLFTSTWSPTPPSPTPPPPALPPPNDNNS